MHNGNQADFFLGVEEEWRIIWSNTLQMERASLSVVATNTSLTFPNMAPLSLLYESFMRTFDLASPS